MHKQSFVILKFPIIIDTVGSYRNNNWNNIYRDTGRAVEFLLSLQHALILVHTLDALVLASVMVSSLLLWQAFWPEALGEGRSGTVIEGIQGWGDSSRRWKPKRCMNTACWLPLQFAYGLPKDGATCSGLGSPALMNNQGNVSQTCSQANLIYRILTGGFPPSWLGAVSSWQWELYRRCAEYSHRRTPTFKLGGACHRGRTNNSRQ